MLKLTVLGHLGKDAIVNDVNGKSVINFSVAHSEKVKDAQGNQVAKSIWVECAYWTDKTAIAPYLKKGTQVYVEGNGDLKSYTKNDGTTASNLTCRVSMVQLLGNKEEAAAPQQPMAVNNGATQRPVQANSLTEPLDELPF